MASNFSDVGDFHEKFGLRRSDKGDNEIQEIDEDLLKFRLKFLWEELDEFEAGLKVEDHAQMFDALLDLVYVAMGTAHLLGYPWQDGWNAVQHANMQKVRAAKDGSDSKRGSSFDVVKPEGWTAPDIEAILSAAASRLTPQIDEEGHMTVPPVCKVCGADLNSLDTRCTTDYCRGVE